MKEKESRYFSIYRALDYVPQGMLLLSRDYKVLFWNKCLEKWTKISGSDICGKDLRSFFPHFDQPAYSSRLNMLFEEGLSAVFSSQLHSRIIPAQFPNGRDRILNTIVTAVPSLDNEKYCALFSIEDVSALSSRIADYKKMKDKALAEIEQRKKIEKELVENNEILNSILSSSPVGITLISFGRIKWANKAIQNLFGIEKESDYKDKPVEIMYADSDEYQRVTKQIKESFEAGTTPEIEAKFLKKDGTEFIGQLMVTSHDKDNSLNKMVAIVVDLTARLKAENDRIMKEKLQSALEMTGAVCHEMNQPIMAITCYSELLLNNLDKDDPIFDKIEKIHTQSIRTGNITKKLMNLSRYETKDYTKGEKIVNIYSGTDNTGC
jgi:PAS domain S-box-containing protein